MRVRRAPCHNRNRQRVRAPWALQRFFRSFRAEPHLLHLPRVPLRSTPTPQGDSTELAEVLRRGQLIRLYQMLK